MDKLKTPLGIEYRFFAEHFFQAWQSLTCLIFRRVNRSRTLRSDFYFDFRFVLIQVGILHLCVIKLYKCEVHWNVYHFKCRQTFNY